MTQMAFGKFLVFFVAVSISTISKAARIYVERGDLDIGTYLVSPHEVCNEISCISVDKLFFVEDSSIVCPFGRLKIAYSDQSGKFRVASAQTNKARRSTVSSRLVENCERQETSPRYMSPTFSSLQKAKKNFFIRNKTSTTTETIAAATTTTVTTTSIYNMPLGLSSILTDDDTFQTASCSFSVADLEYLKHKFPHNLFDDTGDAIYGTGLVAALISFIITLVKLLAKKRSAEVQPKIISPNAYSSPARPMHSTASQFISAQHPPSLNVQPLRERQTGVSDIVLVSSLPVQASVPLQQSMATVTVPLHSSISQRQQATFPEPPQSVLTVSHVNEEKSYKELAFCGCTKGTCTSSMSWMKD